MRYKSVFSHARLRQKLAVILLAVPCLVVVGTTSALASPAATAPASSHLTKRVPAQSVSDVVWWNRSTGVVASWLQNGAGSVLGTRQLNWTCTAASGCSSQWQPIGLGDVNGDGHPDLTWFNKTTGVVSSWLLNGAGTVLGTQALTYKCTAAPACSSQWQPIGLGDVNGDGHPDLMWFNKTTGVVSSWLLNGAGTVLGTQALTYKCTAASGCSSRWQPIGLGDVNGDDH